MPAEQDMAPRGARKLRWLVVGAGGIALRRTIPQGIVPAANAELVGLYAPHSGRRVAEAFGVPAADDLPALFSTPADCAYIASPTDLHAAHVAAAARAGLHVLCEKPLALNESEAEEAVAVCRSAGVELGIALMMRFHAKHQMAASLIANGAIGRITFARAQLSCWYPPIEGAWRQDPARSGGGCVADLGCHCVDLLEMLLGPAVTIGCSTSNAAHHYSVEDTAVIVLRFACGATGVVDCSFAVHDAASANRLEVYGTRGALVAEGTIGQTAAGVLQLYEADTPEYDAQQERAKSAYRDVSTLAVSPYRAQIEAFSEAILSGRPAPVGVRQALRSQRLLTLAYESARTNQIVAVSASAEPASITAQPATPHS